MENNERRNSQRRQFSPLKYFFLIICIYFIMHFSQFNGNNDDNDREMIDNIKNQSINITFLSILQSFSGNKEGIWESTFSGDNKNIAWKKEGMFTCNVVQKINNTFQVQVVIKNGDYIDDGVLRLYLGHAKAQDWNNTRNDLYVGTILQKNEEVHMYEEKIFQTLSVDYTNITTAMLQFSLEVKKEKLVKIFKIRNLSGIKEMTLTISNQQDKFFSSIILASLLFIIACCSFFSLIEIFRKLFEGTQQAVNFSFLTFLGVMLWDMVFCLISFNKALFSEQSMLEDNFLLFIAPSLVFLLLFMNLQSRILFKIFESNTERTTREIICCFNLILYGSEFLLLPVLYFTNLNNMIFIFASLIYLPQIYTNAHVGKRPNPYSSYYNQFLLPRFLIILYLRCFPYNIYELKPSYLTGFCCLVLVGIQFAMLWVQKIYGPKKIFPAFLLPPIFSYNMDEPDVEQAEKCTICLQNIQTEQEDKDESAPSKIMKTPCGHIFHGICLITWMNMKMECPQCRSKLPNYE